MIGQFRSMFGRYKLAGILNIIGLSVSFAAFVLIMIQVWTEFSSGTDDPKHKNIYRIETKYQSSDKWSLRMGFKIYEKLAEVTPQISEFAIFTLAHSDVKVGDTQYFGVPTIYQGNDLSKVIDYHMIEGVASSSLPKGCVIINQSNAQRMFGNESAIGKQIYVGMDDCVVTGVYRDFPANSMSPNGVVIFEKYGMCSAYFLFKEGVDIKQIADSFNKQYMSGEFEGSGEIKFVALADTYFDNQYVSGDFYKQGNMTSTLLLLSIALLIIVVAIINFINFSTALAPVRMRSLNVRGVLGSTKRELRGVIIYEALIFSVVSFFVALLWVVIVNDTSIVKLFKTSDFSLESNFLVILCVGLLSVVIGVLAGIYPALYCTQFSPALVLKGSFGRSLKGQALRNALVCVQFVISTVLIIGALFIHLQNSYLLNKNLGYDSENVIVVRGVWDRNADLMAQKIKNLAMIKSSASFDGQFGQKMGEANEMILVGSDTVMLHNYFVDHNFLDLMNIPIIQGRGLTADDPKENMFGDGTETLNIVVNKSAFRALNASLDSIVKSPKRSYKIVGVTDDVIGHSLYTSGDLMLFTKSEYITSVVAKVDAAQGENALREIRKVAQEVQPYSYTDIEFFDTKIASQYEKERDLSMLITLFSLLAIVISLMGVFGLVVFDTTYRRKEIALRKVHGATVDSILVMFNRKFVTLVVVCFLISSPMAWYGVNEWLKNFAYRTPIYVWVFGVALLIILFITILTVTVQSWRAASENPIKSLSAE